MRAGQIQLVNGALAQVVVELATIQTQHLAVIHDRDHQRTVEVLVAGLAQDAKGLQTAPNFSTGLAVLLRQTIRQGSIGHVQLEVPDQFGMIPATLVELLQGIGILLQCRTFIPLDAASFARREMLLN
jgi:hypothetical protein